MNGLAKSNNIVEGWHRGFHSLLGADHLTIWKLTDALKSDHSLNELRTAQYSAGYDRQPGRKSYQDREAHLKNIVEDFESRNTFDYLDSVARILIF